jgi:uncharacterized phiE125 gp8 family phage protein
VATTIITPPSVEPVTVAEAKKHLRVEHSEDDAQITSLIVAARRGFETRTNRSLVTRTYRLDLDRFPAGRGQIRLPFGPALSVAAVAYLDDNGAPVTVSAGDYILDKTSDVATLTPVPDQCWPWATPRPGGVSVTYNAGYGDASAVPDDAKAAILLMLADFYDNRGTDQPLSRAAKDIIDDLTIEQLA